MTRSNASASETFQTHSATAGTDVTGFGLAGHLMEMLEHAETSVEISLAALPVLEGALDAVRSGYLSTLDPENRRVAARIGIGQDHAGYPRYALLFDPQTAGGLLASVPGNRADACLEALKAAGYAESAIIGTVREGDIASQVVAIVD